MKCVRSFITIFIMSIGLYIPMQEAATADLVVFSYNRPLQLYCFLESVREYVIGLDSIYIVYRADGIYDAGYQEIKNEFPEVILYKQGSNPRADFKPLTEHASFNSQNPYIIYAVDDIIVKDYIDVSACIDLLEKTHAYGFYFRLGKNLDECYMLHCAQPLPPLQQVSEKVYSWTIAQGLYDWQYPNTLDMTLYRKADIKRTICSLRYDSPNTFEAYWHHHHSREVMHRKGLCFELSAIVNIPMNLVQQDYTGNRHMAEIPVSQLWDTFKKGLKIDRTPLFQIVNRGAHMEFVPTYIVR